MALTAHLKASQGTDKPLLERRGSKGASQLSATPQGPRTGSICNKAARHLTSEKLTGYSLPNAKAYNCYWRASVYSISTS